MPSAGEVVALAVAAVDLAELRLVAQALVAAALAAPAAQLLALGLPAGTQVHVAGFALLALAASAQVAGFTLARSAVVGACTTTRGTRFSDELRTLLSKKKNVSG